MSESQARYLDTFPTWLKELGRDAAALSQVLEARDAPRPTLELVAGGLNYLFKSLDLIPDGIDDIGYLDDAFVLRVAAELAQREDLSTVKSADVATMGRLAEENDTVRSFLDVDYERLERYVMGLRSAAARGRRVGEILDQDAVRSAFLSDVSGFNASYDAPSFTREEKTLIKLRAFFDAKLPK
jgi:uncharacterized membrane protein YkvA (DUF1232 family)